MSVVGAANGQHEHIIIIDDGKAIENALTRLGQCSKHALFMIHPDKRIEIQTRIPTIETLNTHASIGMLRVYLPARLIQSSTLPLEKRQRPICALLPIERILAPYQHNKSQASDMFVLVLMGEPYLTGESAMSNGGIAGGIAGGSALDPWVWGQFANFNLFRQLPIHPGSAPRPATKWRMRKIVAEEIAAQVGLVAAAASSAVSGVPGGSATMAVSRTTKSLLDMIAEMSWTSSRRRSNRGTSHVPSVASASPAMSAIFAIPGASGAMGVGMGMGVGVGVGVGPDSILSSSPASLSSSSSASLLPSSIVGGSSSNNNKSLSEETAAIAQRVLKNDLHLFLQLALPTLDTINEQAEVVVRNIPNTELERQFLELSIIQSRFAFAIQPLPAAPRRVSEVQWRGGQESSKEEEQHDCDVLSLPWSIALHEHFAVAGRPLTGEDHERVWMTPTITASNTNVASSSSSLQDRRNEAASPDDEPGQLKHGREHGQHDMDERGLVHVFTEGAGELGNSFGEMRWHCVLKRARTASPERHMLERRAEYDRVAELTAKEKARKSKQDKASKTKAEGTAKRAPVSAPMSVPARTNGKTAAAAAKTVGGVSGGVESAPFLRLPLQMELANHVTDPERVRCILLLSRQLQTWTRFLHNLVFGVDMYFTEQRPLVLSGMFNLSDKKTMGRLDVFLPPHRTMAATATTATSNMSSSSDGSSPSSSSSSSSCASC